MEYQLRVAFNLDVELLKKLNPDIDFGTDGDYTNPGQDTMILIIRDRVI